MGLIDKDNLLKEWRDAYQYAKSHDMTSEMFFFGACIDQVENIGKEIDPVHYAGGCYCRECEFWTHDDDVDFLCAIFGKYTQGDSFCSYGRRREGGE